MDSLSQRIHADLVDNALRDAMRGGGALTDKFDERLLTARISHYQELEHLSHLRPSQHAGQGDVLIAVDFPHRQEATCSASHFFNARMTMPYSKLVSLRSSKLEALLSEKAQRRMRRRLSDRDPTLDPILRKIGYVLDLTPTHEGDDAAAMLANLSLTKGIKSWYNAARFKPDDALSQTDPLLPRPFSVLSTAAAAQVPDALVSGHDEICRCVGTAQQWDLSSVSCITPSVLEPAFRDIPEYCEVRHCANIVRLFQFLAKPEVDTSRTLLIDSAARMWTLVQIARSLDLTEAIRAEMMLWFLRAPNSKIVEILAEECYVIGLITKIEDITVPAFTVLVNELAIDYAADLPSPTTRKVSFLDRKREDLGDFGKDALQHAARTLADRAKSSLERLHADNIFEALGIREWQRISVVCSNLDISDDEDATKAAIACDELKKALLTSWRGTLDRVTREALPQSMLLERVSLQRAHYAEEAVTLPVLKSKFEALNPTQKTLLPFFWLRLRDETQSISGWPRSDDSGRVGLAPIIDRYDAAVMKADAKGSLRVIPADLQKDLGSYRTWFDLNLFRHGLEQAVKDLCDTMLNRNLMPNFQFCISDHLLLNLQHDELKYLPTWTEAGQDDGSGAVFQSEIPPAAMGPNEPGPGYHTGMTVATDTSSSSMVDLGQELADLTVLTETDAATVGPDSARARHGTSASDIATTDDSYSIVTPEGSDFSMIDAVGG